MKIVKRLAGVAALGVLAMQAVPALAQGAGKQEVTVYAGALFGDDLTSQAISGRTPKPRTTTSAGNRLPLFRTTSNSPWDRRSSNAMDLTFTALERWMRTN